MIWMAPQKWEDLFFIQPFATQENIWENSYPGAGSYLSPCTDVDLKIALLLSFCLHSLQMESHFFGNPSVKNLPIFLIWKPTALVEKIKNLFYPSFPDKTFTFIF